MARSKRPVNSKTKFGDRCVIGIDGDVNHAGVVVVAEGEMVDFALIKPRPGSEEKRVRMIDALAVVLTALVNDYRPDLVVVEWQAIRPSDPRPNDILELCAIGAGCLGILSAVSHVPILTPLPVQWKGSVKKVIHQPKILTVAGLTVDDFEGVNRGDVNHVVDALGLAIWGTQ